MPAIKTDLVPLVVGLSLCGASAALLYLWFTTNSDEEDAHPQQQRSSSVRPTVDRLRKLSRQIVRQVSSTALHSDADAPLQLECAIPNDLVALVAGRSGANLRAIEAQTGCTIAFRASNAESQLCEITGPTSAAVQAAANAIRKQCAPPPIVTEVMLVPRQACALIVGRCGETLHDICCRSMAKVYVDAAERLTSGGDGNAAAPDSPSRSIMITGTPAHVQLARTLIGEKLREAEQLLTMRREPRVRSASGRTSPVPSVTSAASSDCPDGVVQVTPPGATLPATADGNRLDVYVSAIASPSRFWLQLIGPQSQRLDRMVAEMTEYYGIEANRQAHRIPDPYLGQIVAALFKYDGKWYRAEIVGIMPNEYNPRNVVLDLYFVDFGDSEYVAPNEVYELRTDFLTLRFQAIECFLAGVKSTQDDRPDDWTPDAISRFEEVTHVAQWTKMHARIVTTKDRKYGDVVRQESAPVPGVELFDSNEINIASILVRESYAIEDVPRSPSLRSFASDTRLHDGRTSSRSSNGSASPMPGADALISSTTSAASESFIETEKRQMLSNNNR